MYYPYFLSYMLVGLTVALIVFVWAYRNGQFGSQQRARFLPLEGEMDAAAPAVSPYHRHEFWGLAILVGAGLIATAALLLFALLSG